MFAMIILGHAAVILSLAIIIYTLTLIRLSARHLLGIQY
jgi:hypothetical protein